MHQMLTPLAAAIPASLMAFTSGCLALADNTFTAAEDRTLSLASPGPTTLDISTRNGHIDVRAVGEDAGDTIEVTAKITSGGETEEHAIRRLEQTDFVVRIEDESRLVIQVEFPEPRTNGDRANLTVRLPQADGGRISSRNGRITLHDLSGKITASTSNGPVDVGTHHGLLEVRTSNGPVNLDQVHGPVDARTRNGNITLTLHPDATGPIELQTSNGNIEASVGPAFRGEVSMQTSRGSVSTTDSADRLREKNLGRRGGTVLIGETEGTEPSSLSTRNGRIRLHSRQDS